MDSAVDRSFGVCCWRPSSSSSSSSRYGVGEDRWVLWSVVEIWESEAEAEAMDGVVCMCLGLELRGGGNED